MFKLYMSEPIYSDRGSAIRPYEYGMELSVQPPACLVSSALTETQMPTQGCESFGLNQRG